MNKLPVLIILRFRFITNNLKLIWRNIFKIVYEPGDDREQLHMQQHCSSLHHYINHNVPDVDQQKWLLWLSNHKIDKYKYMWKTFTMDTEVTIINSGSPTVSQYKLTAINKIIVENKIKCVTGQQYRGQMRSNRHISFMSIGYWLTHLVDAKWWVWALLRLAGSQNWTAQNRCHSRSAGTQRHLAVNNQPHTIVVIRQHVKC